MTKEIKTVLLAAIIATIGITPVVVYADSCYASGYDAGRNGPFSQAKFAQCGAQYEHGFMAGCLSVKGNDQQVCNMAEDAGQ